MPGFYLYREGIRGERVDETYHEVDYDNPNWTVRRKDEENKLDTVTDRTGSAGECPDADNTLESSSRVGSDDTGSGTAQP